MDPCLKLNFPKLQEIRIQTFLSEFSVSNQHVSPRFAIFKGKFIYLEMSLIATNVSLSFLQCSTTDPWLKLKFPKLLEIRIWTSLSAKCHISLRFAIVKRKLVYFEISLIATMFVSFVFKVFNYEPMSKTQVFKTSRNQNLDFLELIQK